MKVETLKKKAKHKENMVAYWFMVYTPNFPLFIYDIIKMDDFIEITFAAVSK